MIGRNQRFRRTVQSHMLQTQGFVVVNVIEMQNRKQPRIGPAVFHVKADVGAAKFACQHSRDLAVSPFVEITDDDSRSVPVCNTAELRLGYQTCLTAPLEES